MEVAKPEVPSFFLNLRLCRSSALNSESETIAPAERSGDESVDRKLESAEVSLYLDAPEKWARLVLTTPSFNDSYVNTNCMVEQYNRNACSPGPLLEHAPMEERVFAI